VGNDDHDSVAAPQDRAKVHAGRLLIWVVVGAVGGVTMALLIRALSGSLGVAIFIAIAIGVALGFGRRRH
jgi:hypothetical protein